MRKQRNRGRGMTLIEEKDRVRHNCGTDIILQENMLKAIDHVLRSTHLFPLSTCNRVYEQVEEFCKELRLTNRDV